MDASELTEGRKVNYSRRLSNGATDAGTGKVVEVTRRGQTRVILHDKTKNKAVTVYPSQCTPWKRGQ